jgi:hypothetical protein
MHSRVTKDSAVDQLAFYSREVEKAVQKTVWAKLKALGFTKFTGRTAWRFGDVTHVVEFQRFTGKRLDILGYTRLSFFVNLGLRFQLMTGPVPLEDICAHRLPKPSRCTFRKRLRRALTDGKNPDPRIWSIEPNGSNIDLCIRQVLELIEREALPWFGELSDPFAALRFLETEEERFDKFGPCGTWGVGRIGSPRRQNALASLREFVLTQHSLSLGHGAQVPGHTIQF